MNRVKRVICITVVILLGAAIATSVNKAYTAEIPEYKILTSQHVQDLEAEVFGKLVDGYELRGDLIVVHGNSGLEYIQVVTK